MTLKVIKRRLLVFCWSCDEGHLKREKKLPSLQFVITDRMSLISPFISNDQWIPLSTLFNIASACRPSYSNLSKDADAEGLNWGLLRQSYSLTTRTYLIHIRLDHMHTRLDIIHTRLDLIWEVPSGFNDNNIQNSKTFLCLKLLSVSLRNVKELIWVLIRTLHWLYLLQGFPAIDAGIAKVRTYCLVYVYGRINNASCMLMGRGCDSGSVYNSGILVGTVSLFICAI